MLEIVNLSKRYENGVLAVDRLSLTVEPGEIFVMLSANGAGKSTTMMCVLGFTEPTDGTARPHAAPDPHVTQVESDQIVKAMQEKNTPVTSRCLT